VLAFSVEPFLFDRSPLARAGAAFALGLLPCRESAQLLANRLQTETDMETLRQLALSLGQVGTIEHLQLLQNHLDYGLSKTTLYKTDVHFFSRGIVSSSFVSECCHALLSANLSERQTAAVALQRIRQPELILPHLSTLLSAAYSRDPFVRYTVARILRECTFSLKNDLYFRYLSDHDWRVRYESAMTIPFLTLADTSWLTLLRDQHPYVIAAALQNPPINIRWNNEILDIISDLLSSKFRSVRGSAARFVCAQTDSVFQKMRLSLMSNKELLPEIITGYSTQLPDRDAFDLILLHINHRKKPVSTTAYSGIVNHLDSLIIYKQISERERRHFIISGLDSSDPVKIYLAANYIYSALVQIPDIEQQLYGCLKKSRGVQYLESQLMIIQAIEKLHPADAPKYLFPLLNSKHRQLQNEAYRILVNSYGEQISKPPPAPDSYLYRSLSKLKKYGLSPMVEIETSRGTIMIQCNAYYTPYTVDAFLNRVDSGYYNGLFFHRVVPNFVVQTGDPRGDGWGGPNYHLRTERSPLSYEAGSVGMANAGPDTEGSQFFITTSPQYHLDYNYTLFGQVTEGMDIYKMINVGDKIISARIITSSK